MTQSKALQQALKGKKASDWVLPILFEQVTGMLRPLPLALFAKASKQCFVSVEVDGSDPAFDWLNVWMSQHPSLKNVRSVEVNTVGGTEYEPLLEKHVSNAYVIRFTPSPGTYTLAFRGKRVWLTKFKDISVTSIQKRSSSERITIRMVGRSLEPIKELLEEGRKLALSKEETRIQIKAVTDWGWNTLALQAPRSLDSVILDRDVKDNLLEDITRFIENPKWYWEKGIPYRRGYLFHGIPGSGKTSLILALAGHFRLPVHILSLSSGKVDDSSLLSSLLSVQGQAIVLLEDADAVFEGRERTEPGRGVTFSGLLNALDGVTSSDGRLLFMTTNHVKKLDSALIRPGRIDYHLEFHNATNYQAEELFLRFFPDAPTRLTEQFGDLSQVGMSMAQLQNHLLLHQNDAERAVEEMRDYR